MGSLTRKGSANSGQSAGISQGMDAASMGLLQQGAPLRAAGTNILQDFLGGTPQFDEQTYLKNNPDVASAVQKGDFSSGLSHYSLYGQKEGRQAPYLPGGGPVGQLPDFLKSTVGLTVPLQNQEQQLQTARQGIMDSGVRGGQLGDNLAQLSMQRLLGQNQLEAQRAGINDATRQNLFQTALGTGFNTVPTALTGMGSAAGNLNSLGAQRIQQNQAAMQSIGSMLGKGATMGANYGLPAPGAGSLGAAKLA